MTRMTGVMCVLACLNVACGHAPRGAPISAQPARAADRVVAPHITVERYAATTGVEAEAGLVLEHEGQLALIAHGQVKWRATHPFKRVFRMDVKLIDGHEVLAVSDWDRELRLDAETGARVGEGARSWRSDHRVKMHDDVCVTTRDCTLTLEDCRTDARLLFLMGVEEHWYLDDSGEHTNVCAVQPYYVGQTRGALIIFDADRHDSKSLAISPTGSVYSHGFGGSHQEGRLVALDRKTAKPLWKSALVPAGFGGVPTSMGVLGDAGICWIASARAGAVVGLDCKTGRERWQQRLPVPAGTEWSTVEDIGSTLVVVTRGDDELLTVFSLDLASGAPGWHVKLAEHETPVLKDRIPFSVDASDINVWIDATSGRITKRAPHPIGDACPLTDDLVTRTSLRHYCIEFARAGGVRVRTRADGQVVAELPANVKAYTWSVEEPADDAGGPTRVAIWVPDTPASVVMLTLPVPGAPSADSAATPSK